MLEGATPPRGRPPAARPAGPLHHHRRVVRRPAAAGRGRLGGRDPATPARARRASTRPARPTWSRPIRSSPRGERKTKKIEPAVPALRAARPRVGAPDRPHRRLPAPLLRAGHSRTASSRSRTSRPAPGRCGSGTRDGWVEMPDETVEVVAKKESQAGQASSLPAAPRRPGQPGSARSEPHVLVEDLVLPGRGGRRRWRSRWRCSCRGRPSARPSRPRQKRLARACSVTEILLRDFARSRIQLAGDTARAESGLDTVLLERLARATSCPATPTRRPRRSWPTSSSFGTKRKGDAGGAVPARPHPRARRRAAGWWRAPARTRSCTATRWPATSWLTTRSTATCATTSGSTAASLPGRRPRRSSPRASSSGPAPWSSARRWTRSSPPSWPDGSTSSSPSTPPARRWRPATPVQLHEEVLARAARAVQARRPARDCGTHRAVRGHHRRQVLLGAARAPARRGRRAGRVLRGPHPAGEGDRLRRHHRRGQEERPLVLALPLDPGRRRCSCSWSASASRS